eukprot:6631016-Prorocentrum_lima.AAC.1
MSLPFPWGCALHSFLQRKLNPPWVELTIVLVPCDDWPCHDELSDPGALVDPLHGVPIGEGGAF